MMMDFGMAKEYIYKRTGDKVFKHAPKKG